MALEYFPCYHSYSRSIAKLSDQEVGRLFRALLAYSEFGETQELTGREAVAYDFMVSDIARAKQAYETKCFTLKANGSKGGRPPKNQKVFEKTICNKSKSKSNSKSNSESKSEEVPPSVPPRGRFAPPAVEEVAAYVLERGGKIDPQAFVDFYASKGWLIGKEPMKDWRAAVRTWERRERSEGQRRVSKGPSPDTGTLGAADRRAREDVERMRRIMEQEGELV